MKWKDIKKREKQKIRERPQSSEDQKTNARALQQLTGILVSFVMCVLFLLDRR